jgi:hypothetical protein
MNYTKFFMDAELYSSSIEIEVKYNHRKLMKNIGQSHTVADLGGTGGNRPYSINSFVRKRFMLFECKSLNEHMNVVTRLVS